MNYKLDVELFNKKYGPYGYDLVLSSLYVYILYYRDSVLSIDIMQPIDLSLECLEDSISYPEFKKTRIKVNNREKIRRWLLGRQ